MSNADAAPTPARPGPPEAHRFRPGQSGNPGGRPKGQSITARLREALDAPFGNDRQRADALVAVLLTLALKGDRNAIRLVIDRVDGKALDRPDPTPAAAPVDLDTLPDADLRTLRSIALRLADG